MIDQRESILGQWSDFIMESAAYKENPAGFSDAKMYMVSTIAHNKYAFITESYTAATPSNSNGVGAVTLPENPGTYADFHDATRATGSGDPAIAILGLGMSVAAHTFAFDLLPVVPIHSELAIIEYAVPKYTGGRMDSATPPKIAKVADDNLFSETVSAGDSIIIHGADGEAAAYLTFIQYARLEKAFIVKVESIGTYTTAGGYIAGTTGSVDDAVAAATNYIVDSGTSTALDSLSIDFANPSDDHVSAAAAYGDVDGEPVDRATAEDGTDYTIEIETKTKAIQAKSYTIMGKMSRQQARMFKSKGLDGIPSLKRQLQNDITQSINKDILKRMRRLGVTNHINMYYAQGVNLNLYVGPATTSLKALTAFGTQPMIDAAGVDRTAEFGSITNAETNSAAENLYSRQARIRSKCLLAAALGATTSRNGAFDAIVVNTQLLAAIKESKGYQASQVTNTLTQSTKALYYAGTLSDLKVYCDPNMLFTDTTVMVMRTNKSADGMDYESLNEGLVFLPYDLAVGVDIISEGTMSSKFLVESVYALAETGVHPELAYLTFACDTDFGGWS